MTDAVREWVQDRIDSGLYANASDYVSDLIRRDHESTGRSEAPINALIEGEKSGVTARNVRDILAELREDTAGRA